MRCLFCGVKTNGDKFCNKICENEFEKKKKFCNFCGNEFLPSNKYEIYCTVTCRNLKKSNRKCVKPNTIIYVKCLECGKDFEKNGKSAYCSIQCRNFRLKKNQLRQQELKMQRLKVKRESEYQEMIKINLANTTFDCPWTSGQLPSEITSNQFE